MTYAFTSGTAESAETPQKQIRIGAWRCAAFGSISISRGGGAGFRRDAPEIPPSSDRGWVGQAQAAKFEAFDRSLLFSSFSIIGRMSGDKKGGEFKLHLASRQ